MANITINNNPSANVDMIHKKGNAFSFSVQIVDTEGVPQNLTGQQFKFDLTDDTGSLITTYGTATSGLSIDGQNTSIVFDAPIDSLDALASNAYKYEFYKKQVGGNISLLHGKFKIVDSVHKIAMVDIAQNGSLFQILLDGASVIKLETMVPIGIQRRILNVNADTVIPFIPNVDWVIYASNNLSIFLPSAIANTNSYKVKMITPGLVRIVPYSGQTIDSVSSSTISIQNDWKEVLSDGVNLKTFR